MGYSLKIDKNKIKICSILVLIAIMVTMCNYVIINKRGYLGTDVAVWTNIAIGMKQGKVIYKDMFDHKGPILYFFYYFAYAFGKELGIWILDFMCNVITVAMVYLISKLIVKEKWKIFLIIIICALLLAKIGYENPSTESIALPFSLIAFYFGINYIFDNNSLKKKEMIYISICFANVLLLRPNLLVLWVIFYIALLVKLCKEKDFKNLLQIILYSILGVSIILIPTIIYFIKNNAVDYFINSYIFSNLQYINNKENSVLRTIMYFSMITNYVIVFVGVIYITLLFFRKKIEKKDYQLLVFSFIYYLSVFYLVIMPQRCYAHYLISMIPTLIVPLAITLKYIEVKKVFILLASFVYAIAFWKIQINKNGFINQLSVLEEKLKPITQFSKKEDNVLVLGNKTIIYLMTDRQYNGRYFYQTSVANQNIERANEILEDIISNSPKFIVDTLMLHKKDKRDYFEEKIAHILDTEYIKINNFVYERMEELS